ncbi:phage tail tube protein [Antribacter gilvus]|uniref:phage tail tube protein n=1 Tax=Antribacter gilvus TaxID=2304675 RepID=UPI000F7AEB31|nr:phage tail tube protein [Antribacter gilvus]
MTTQLDCSIGLKKETTYGTPVTVDQFLEFESESLNRTAEFAQGEGMRVGSRIPLANRNFLGREQVDGDINLVATTKALGGILEAAFGTVTNTPVPTQAGVFQQVHTPATTDPLPSYTIQKGVPPVGGGATVPLTFAGMMCNQIQFSADPGGLLQIGTTWTGREVLLTGTPYAAPSYPAGLDVFSFVHGAIVLGGTVTAATADALASGGTVLGNIRSFSLQWNQGLDDNVPTLGAQGRRSRRNVVGRGELSGSITAEFTDTSLLTAQMNRSNLALLLTFTHTSTIGTSANPVVQIHVPVVKLDNALPQSNGGDVIATQIPFVGLQPDAGPAIRVVYRTTDLTP